MKRFLSSLILVFAVFFSACQIFFPDDSSQTTPAKPKPINPKPNPDPKPSFTNSDNKRGLCYNSLNEAEIKVLSDSKVKWVYNWGTNPTAQEDALFTEYGITFIPMMWGLSNSNALANLRTYYRNHPECKYLLGYNEPNLGASVGGSGITPSAAARDWKNLEDIADEFGLALVGPALQYSGETLSDGKIYDTPKSWMDAFIKSYKALYEKEPRFDYFCLHCYMNWPSAQSGYVKEYVKEYGKKVWLTEFCAWEYNNGGQNESVAAQTSSMVEKIEFLDSYDGADKYAWFMSSQNTNQIPFNSLFPKVNSDGSLTSLGEEYLYHGIDSIQLLRRTLEKAQDLLDAAEPGSNPGEYPASAISALQSACDDANTAFGYSDDSSLKTAYKSLMAAINDFQNARIKVFTKSTALLSASDFSGSLTKGLPSSAFSTSYENGANTPEKAFDGNKDTRWESEHKDNQWLAVDFGKEVEFNTIRFIWEAAYSTSFSIETSENGTDWESIMDVTDCNGGSETYRFTLMQKARHVRFYGKTRATGYGHSFYEWGISKE